MLPCRVISLMESAKTARRTGTGYIDLDTDYFSEALGSPLGIGIIAFGIIALTGVVIFLIKRRYDDVMGGARGHRSGLCRR